MGGRKKVRRETVTQKFRLYREVKKGKTKRGGGEKRNTNRGKKRR